MENSNTKSNIPWFLAWNTANTNSDILDLLENSRKLWEALVKSGLLKDSDVKKITDYQEKSFNKWKTHSFWKIIFSSSSINRKKILDFIASRWIELTDEEKIKIVETSPTKTWEPIAFQQDEIITRTEKILEKTKMPKKKIWEMLIDANFITQRDLDRALEYQREKEMKGIKMMIGDVILILNMVDKRKFLNFVNAHKISMMIWELLIANNIIDWEKLENAIVLQREWKAKWVTKHIGDILVEDMKAISKEKLLKIVAQQKNMIRMKPSISGVDPRIFPIFSKERKILKELNFVPYKIFHTYKNEDKLWDNSKLVPEIKGCVITVLSDECSGERVDKIKKEILKKSREIKEAIFTDFKKEELDVLSIEIVFEYATKEEISPFIDECVKNEGVFKKMSKEKMEPKQDLKGDSGVFNLWEKYRSATNDNLNKFADILMESIDLWASDIHIEPEDNRVRIRARVDWVLQQIWELPIQISKWFTSSIKNYFGFADSYKTNETKDERISAYYHKKDAHEKDIKVDIRFSLMPTNFWETIVARILVQKDIIPSIQELWMRLNIARKCELVTILPSGIVIVTWPTWSGKTTTLYSILSSLNSDEKNIMTVENPIEYTIKWANQIDAWWKYKMKFSEVLNWILRQDPDILMFWEMRDLESAQNAITAGLTGRLLFTTLHTNDSISAIDRLINLWIEPFFLGSTLVSLIGQRLIRKICPHCATDYTPNENDLSYLKRYVKDMGSYIKKHNIKFKKWKGCDHCRDTWYKWRVSIVELFCVNEELKKAVVARKTAAELETIARKYGMTSMAEDGFCRVIEWETTLEEVLKVVRTNQLPKQKRTMEEIQRLLYWEMNQEEIENAVYGESMDEKPDINEQIIKVLEKDSEILEEWVQLEKKICANEEHLAHLAESNNALVSNNTLALKELRKTQEKIIELLEKQNKEEK